jgi:uncharacterized membrane protein
VACGKVKHMRKSPLFAQRFNSWLNAFRSNRLFNLLEIFQGQLWFQPAFMCLLFGGFTLGLYEFEAHFIVDAKLPAFFFNANASEVRNVSIALLSAMLTMATLVVSITMVVLSLAAGQQGPRLIRSFMAHPHTQRFMGVFFGIVVSIFTLVIIIHDVTLKDSSPDITITTVFGLCFLSLFVLLAYVHYLAQASISDNVVKRTATELEHSIERLIGSQRDIPVPPEELEKWPSDFQDSCSPILSKRRGYIQYINYEAICDVARRYEAHLFLPVRAGHFIVVGQPLFHWYQPTPEFKKPLSLEADLLKCLVLGHDRTSTQDVTYSIRHLVEIALRALSPSINDCFTAITVMDHLTASLARLFQSTCMDDLHMDKAGTLRLKAVALDEGEIIYESLAHIRHAGVAIPLVLNTLMNNLETLCPLASNAPQRAGMLKEVTALQLDIQAYTPRLQNERECLSRCDAMASKLHA